MNLPVDEIAKQIDIIINDLKVMVAFEHDDDDGNLGDTIWVLELAIAKMRAWQINQQESDWL